MERILSSIRIQVEQRAQYRCEYCQTTVEVSTQKFEIEHIIPLSHEGTDRMKNLALSCRGCNAHKHAKTKGFDEITETYVSLFNPRSDIWSEHFA